MPLAGLAGGIAGGPFIEYLGRKNTILATAVPFIISWLLIACANAIWMVLAGKLRSFVRISDDTQSSFFIRSCLIGILCWYCIIVTSGIPW